MISSAGRALALLFAVILIGLSVSAPASASVVFTADAENTLVNEWAEYSTAPHCTVTSDTVASDTRFFRQSTTKVQGTNAYTSSVINGDNCWGERAEVGQDRPSLTGFSESRRFLPGNEYWVSTQVNLATGFPTGGTGFNNVLQLLQAQGSSNGGAFGALDVRGGRFYWINDGDTGVADYDLGPAVTNRWNKFTIHFKVSSNWTIGFAEIFGDVTNSGTITQLMPLRQQAMTAVCTIPSNGCTSGADLPLYSRLGIYRDSTISGNSSVHYDGYTAATTRTEAEANAFPAPPVTIPNTNLATGTVNNGATNIATDGSTSTTATDASFSGFSVNAGETVTGYECKLDAGAFAACTSPKGYTGLGLGSHTFSLRACNSAGCDATPATRTWTITSPAVVNWKADAELNLWDEWAGISTQTNCAVTTFPNMTDGRISRVTSPKAQGANAWKVHLEPNDVCFDERAEVGQGGPDKPGFENRWNHAGDDVWFAWQMNPSAAVVNTQYWQTNMQWKQLNGGGGAFGINALNGRWQLLVSDTNQPVGGNDYIEFWSAPAVAGTWAKFSLHVKFSPDPTIGFLELYGDPDGTGVRLLMTKRMTWTMKNNTNNIYLRTGIYRDSRNQTAADLYIDGLTSAPTQAAAETNGFG